MGTVIPGTMSYSARNWTAMPRMSSVTVLKGGEKAELASALDDEAFLRLMEVEKEQIEAIEHKRKMYGMQLRKLTEEADERYHAHKNRYDTYDIKANRENHGLNNHSEDMRNASSYALHCGHPVYK